MSDTIYHIVSDFSIINYKRSQKVFFFYYYYLNANLNLSHKILIFPNHSSSSHREIIFNSCAMKRAQGELPREALSSTLELRPSIAARDIPARYPCPNEKGTNSLTRVPSDANRLVGTRTTPSSDDACSLPRDYLSLFSSRSLVPRGLREYRVIDLRFTLVSSLWTVCSTRAANSLRRRGK